MSLPTTHRGITVIEKGKAAIQEKPLPFLPDDFVLIRVKAIALNPTDWKHIDFVLAPGSSVGSDFAGDIVKVGEKAEGKGFKVGDAVAGFLRGGIPAKDNACFQEYLVSRPESIWHKPASLSYEKAAPAGGIALSTAAQALYHRLNISYTPLSTPEPFLVWAGSTTVGQYAIKLATLAGYRVVATASPHNFDLVKSLGAAAAFDYRDPETPAKIRAWVKEQGLGPLRKGVENISDNKSVEAATASFEDGQGDLITLEPTKVESTVNVTRIFVYTGLDPANEDFKKMADWNQRVPKLLEEGKLEGIPLKHWEGGLEGLVEAIDFIRKGKVSGQKIVATIA